MQREKASAIAHLLEHQFSIEGTFWDRGNAAAGADENFTFADFLRGLITVPDMRWWMILGQVWNWIAPKWPKEGLTEAFISDRKYNFRYRSFFSDGIVLEALGRAQQQFDIRPAPGFIASAQAMLTELSGEAILESLPAAKTKEGPIPARLFSFYPIHGHRVPPSDPVFDLFFKTGKNVADTDSTCMVYSTMRSLIDRYALDPHHFPVSAREIDPCIFLIGKHVRGSGVFAQGLPSYDQKVGDLSGAVAVWYKERFNEFEPFANVNILQFCLCMHDRFGEEARIEARRVARSITGFLSRHAERGSFKNPRFNFYYPLSIGLYLWWRCLQTHSTLPPEVAAFFDMDEDLKVIDSELREQARQLFEDLSEKTNRFDRCMAAPYLFSRGIAESTLRHDLAQGLGPTDPLFSTPHVFFRMWYPSKILGMPEKWAMAATLDLYTLVDKHEKIQ
jgi:hypothetical protein